MVEVCGIVGAGSGSEVDELIHCIYRVCDGTHRLNANDLQITWRATFIRVRIKWNGGGF